MHCIESPLPIGVPNSGLKEGATLCLESCVKGILAVIVV